MFKNLFSSNQVTVQAKHENARRLATEDGKKAGLKELPRQGQRLEPFITKIYAQYKELLTHELIKVPMVDDNIASQEAELTATQIKRYERQLKEAQNKHAQKSMERNNYDADHKTHSTWTIHVALCFLAVMEALYTSSAIIRSDHYNIFSRAATICGLFVLFLCLPIGIVWFWRTTAGSRYKLLFRGVGAFVLVACLLLIGQLRVAALQHMGETTLRDVDTSAYSNIKPYVFLGFSAFIFLVTLPLASRLRTPEQRKTNAKAKQLDSELQQLALQIERLESELDSSPIRSINQLLKRNQQRNRRSEITDQVTAMYFESVSCWIAENRLYRTTEEPDCFNNDIPPLM